jgi:polysaccharide pyruvyl transferase WcaK-like protein
VLEGNCTKICLAGASTDTGNLGVSALCLATLGSIFRARQDAKITVFDEGWGVRGATLESHASRFDFHQCGVRYSRRLHRPESLWNIRLSCRLGGLGNPAARALLDADALLDISGGDSFTDLYGPKRFNAVAATKLLALENRIPLILLPQTYGPFEDPARRQTASRIVRESALAWARDEHSFRALKELAGDCFEPDRHRCGVDVAFALETRRPSVDLGPQLENWIKAGTRRAGVNVSGLIHNDPGAAAVQFGLKADYVNVVRELLNRLLSDRDVHVVLIPHVVTRPEHFESDVRACRDVLESFGPDARDRIALCPALSDPREVKWVISKMEWFCGTRMHATIAALSSGVPAAAIAYSLKTAGVFESCGQQDHVADPRALDSEQVLERLWQSWTTRDQARATLSRRLTDVVAKAQEQIELTLDAISQKATITE